MITPRYACRLNDVLVEIERQHDADRSVGTENMMMNGSRSDSYCDAMTAYTRMSARISTIRSSLNAFACCSTSAPKPTLNPCGRGSSAARVHALHSFAERDLRVGADRDDALLVLSIDLRRAELRLNRHHVLRRQRHADCVVTMTSSTSPTC
jgi:hypothetical protein